MKEVGFLNKVQFTPSVQNAYAQNFTGKAMLWMGKTVEWFFDFGQASYTTLDRSYVGALTVSLNEIKRSRLQIALKVAECSLKILLSPLLILPMFLGKLAFRSKHIFLINASAPPVNQTSQQPEASVKEISTNSSEEKPKETQTDSTSAQEIPKETQANSNHFPKSYDIKKEINKHPLIEKITSEAKKHPKSDLALKLKETLKEVLKKEGYGEANKQMSYAEAAKIFYIYTRQYQEANPYYVENLSSKESEQIKNSYILPAYEVDTTHPNSLISQIQAIRSNTPHVTSIPLYMRIKDATPHSTKTHATLVFFDFKTKTLEYFDSNKNYGNQETVSNNLKRVAHSLGLKFEKKVNRQLQTDDYSCVMWTCYFLKKRLEDANFNPNQIEDSRILEHQIRIEAIVTKILSSLESKEERLKNVHPTHYADNKIYKDINRNYFEFFQRYILGLLTGTLYAQNTV